MAKKKPAKKQREKPSVNKELDGFDIHINSFGEIITSYDLDKVNNFLDQNVEDKKLKNKDDVKKKKDSSKNNIDKSKEKK